MKRIGPFVLGLLSGLAGYAACALLFWYGALSPYLVLVTVIVGLICLAIAGVSAVAVFIGLIVVLAEKLEKRGNAR